MIYTAHFAEMNWYDVYVILDLITNKMLMLTITKFVKLFYT